MQLIDLASLGGPASEFRFIIDPDQMQQRQSSSLKSIEQPVVLLFILAQLSQPLANSIASGDERLLLRNLFSQMTKLFAWRGAVRQRLRVESQWLDSRGEGCQLPLPAIALVVGLAQLAK